MRDHPRLRHLAPHEQAMLAEFLSWLQEKWGDRIAHVWLFGSKARGDSDAESDVDVLIVARDADDALRDYVDTEPLRKIKREYVFQHFASKNQT